MMIIGLTGFARSGKDTVADILVRDYGFKRLAFADKLKELAEELNPVLDTKNGTIRLQDVLYASGHLDWEHAKTVPAVRRYLQDLGTMCRQVIGEDVWVNAAHNSAWLPERTVFTDVRFYNESRFIKDNHHGLIARVNRPGVGPVNDHPSEVQHIAPDFRIDNSGSINHLEKEVERLVSFYEETDIHNLDREVFV